MRQEIQDLLDEVGKDFWSFDIHNRLASDWEIAADELACLKPAVSRDEYAEITAFLIPKAERQLEAAQSFSKHVEDMQAMDKRWQAWIEAARAEGKTDLSLSAWRTEVMDTAEQSTAFVR